MSVIQRLVPIVVIGDPEKVIFVSACLGSAVTTILWFGFSWWRNNQSRFLTKSELAGITSIRFGDKAFQKASYAHLRWYRHT